MLKIIDDVPQADIEVKEKLLFCYSIFGVVFTVDVFYSIYNFKIAISHVLEIRVYKIFDNHISTVSRFICIYY